MKITAHVYQVCGQGFSASEDAAIYLISGNGSAALIDAGRGNSIDRLMQMQPDILCEGHFGVIHGRDNVRAFIAQYL